MSKVGVGNSSQPVASGCRLTELASELIGARESRRSRYLSRPCIAHDNQTKAFGGVRELSIVFEAQSDTIVRFKMRSCDQSRSAVTCSYSVLVARREFEI